MDEIHQALRSLRSEVDEATRRDWNRSLPFADGLFDRWERARALGFGEGSSVFDSVHVMGDVSVGERVWIGPSVMLDGSGAPLVVGDQCDISAGVHIYTHDTALRCVSFGDASIVETFVPLNVSKASGEILGVLRIGPTTLAPGASATVLTPVVISETGNYILELDRFDEVRESDEFNNTFTTLLIASRG